MRIARELSSDLIPTYNFDGEQPFLFMIRSYLTRVVLGFLIVWSCGGDDEMFKARLPGFGLLNFFVDFIGCQVSRRPNRLLLALNASVVLPIRSTVDIDAALRLPLPPVLLGAFVVPDERIKICA